MLLDSMRRADRAYWKMQQMLELEAEKMVGLPIKERWPLLRKLHKQVDLELRKLPLSSAAKFGVNYDALAQVKSYI